MKYGLALVCLSLCLSACSKTKSSEAATGDRVSPTYPGPAETDFCATASSYPGGVTITGQAKYVRREVWVSGSHGGLGSALTTGTHPATLNPIRQAEVRVTDPSGAVVQCATTDNTGAFSFTLPVGSVTYTISVNSRSYNQFVRASVLNQPEQNKFYSLTTTVDALGARDVGVLTAGASGDTLGGAFNILDQIYKANEYIYSKVSGCTGTATTGFTGCRTTGTSNPIEKVVAFWTKGYNPNSYFGNTSGLSFYLPGYKRLFILGGQNGDTDNSDTDHYDNSVIIHEYGHFLEDVVGNSDSPGGSHTGTKMIDPRLAWSEGWGNFFQAAVRNDNHYIDTIGNDDGDTDLAFYVDLETADVNDYDYPTQAGQGNFREFAVTRLLWDAVDANADTAFGATDNVVSNAFDEIWAAFSSTTHGFAYSNYAFRNVGLLHLIQRNFQTRSGSYTPPATAHDWATIRTMNRHDGNESQYGQYLSTTTCGAAPYTGGYYFQITPQANVGDDGSFARSDLLNNNDFYHFKAPATGSHTLKLVYKDADGAAQEADLDFYLYKEDYTYGVSSSWVGYSRKDPTGPATTEEEPITVNLTANANYMLNVFAYTGGGTGTQAYYNILYDGSPLCPASLVPQ